MEYDCIFVIFRLTFLSLFFFKLFGHTAHMAMQDPWSGMEPVPSTVEAQILNRSTIGEVPNFS